MYEGIEFDPFGLPYQVLNGIRLDGNPLKAPSMYRANRRIEGIFSLENDPAMKAMMKNAVAAKRGAMIDVGANIGQSLVKWASLDVSRDYIGFEPNPASALQCSLLIHLNQLRNHRVFSVGISENLSAFRLQLNGLLDPSASTVEGFRPEGLFGRSVDILTVNGDEIMDALDVKEIAFLKIDVEGAELEVFKSFQKTIDRVRPFIALEVLPHYLHEKNEVLPDEQVAFRTERYAQIESLLKNLNYSVFDCGAGALEELETIQPGPPGSEGKTRNFLAVSSDFKAELMSRWI